MAHDNFINHKLDEITMKTSKKDIKIYLTLLICAVALPSIAQVKKTFDIRGSLKNMITIPAKIYLNYDQVTGKPSDSSSVDNGRYTFKGNVDASVVATIALVKEVKAEDKERLSVMLDNGTLNIVSDQSLSNSTVTGSGSVANTEFLKINSFAKNESAAINKIKESEAYKTNEALKKEVALRSANLLPSALKNMIDYVRQNPSSPASPYFTYALIAMPFLTPEMTDTLYRAFPAELRSSKLGLAIDATLAKRKKDALELAAKNADERKVLDEMTPLGSKAKDFTQNDVADKPVSLSSFKGKYVLIDFWASWCVPCRAENPNVVKAYHAYKDKNFTILGVSLDGQKTKQAWLDAIKKDGLAWTQVSDLKAFENEAAKLYGVKAIPQNFLIDPNGNIIAKNLRGEELEKKLAAVLK